MGISINSTNDAIKTTVTINGKEFASIPISLLNTESKWQRSLKTSKAKRKIATLVRTWDDNLCRPITVIFDENTGKYDVIDGGHRVAAADLLGREELVAEIIRFNGNTEKEKIMLAARLFAEQGTAVDSLTPAEKHSANLILGIAENLTLEIAAKKHDFSLKLDGSRGRRAKKNYVSGFSQALKFAKYAPDALNFTFDVIDTIHWNEEPLGLGREAIEMIGKVFAYHLGEETKIAFGIVHALTNITPKQAFAEAAVEYKGRGSSSANLLWLEGKVCDYLGINRKYFGQKTSLKTISA